jgi:hypothetical protein
MACHLREGMLQILQEIEATYTGIEAEKSLSLHEMDCRED